MDPRQAALDALDVLMDYVTAAEYEIVEILSEHERTVRTYIEEN